MDKQSFNDFNDFIKGQILLMDKPLFWTSFDVVKKVKRVLERKFKEKSTEQKRIKVGHAGTLDPLADGLVVLATGKKTKELHHLQTHDKKYRAVIELGKTTPSYDLETQYDEIRPYEFITRDKVETVISEFIGETKQYPPVYSAKRVNGKRAYHSARAGEKIEMKPNLVRIDSIEIEDFDLPLITLYISCGKGTYVRSLVNDIGNKLNTGAHLVGLTRTQIGLYDINNAESVKKFEEKIRYL